MHLAYRTPKARLSADRPALEIKVTREMVDAGVSALDAALECLPNFGVVEAVYRAMRALDRGGEPP
jgi:hypothetical protein